MMLLLIISAGEAENIIILSSMGKLSSKATKKKKHANSMSRLFSAVKSYCCLVC